MWSKPTSTDTIFVSDANLKYAKPYGVENHFRQFIIREAANQPNSDLRLLINIMI